MFTFVRYHHSNGQQGVYMSTNQVNVQSSEHIDEQNQEHQKLIQELLRRFMGQGMGPNFPFMPGFRIATNEQQIGTLQQLGIANRKEWLQWLAQNHPDKGGDTQICSKVLEEGRSQGW